MRIPLATALACIALALTACGGDDETTTRTTSTPEAGASGASGASGTDGAQSEEGGGEPAEAGQSDSVEVAEAVAAVVGGSDPEAACSTAVTASYVKSAYGDEQGCRAAVDSQGSFSVAVGDVTVDSENGTAETTAVPDGGPNRGEDLTVRLVEQESGWKVDFLRSDAPAGP